MKLNLKRKHTEQIIESKKKPFQIKYDQVILNLKEKNLINEEQFNKLNITISKPMTQQILVERLVELGALESKEPMDESFKDFKDDLGSLNAGGLVLLVNALRTNKKGLKEMTTIPAKAFPIPANILFMIIIGMALFIVIVFPNLTSIEKGIGMATPGGAGSNPLAGLAGMFNNLGGKH